MEYNLRLKYNSSFIGVLSIIAKDFRIFVAKLLHLVDCINKYGKLKFYSLLNLLTYM